VANIYTIGFNYRQRLANKDSRFWKRRLPIYKMTPGCMIDADRRRFRFDKWEKRPSAAIRLYWRLRAAAMAG
jgi:hypothetical protein